MHSLGWATPCWTSLLWWTRTSLTKFGLKPNDQILAEDKHKALFEEMSRSSRWNTTLEAPLKTP
uniref:Uncharacterized protein n=1 Tax=Anguilla anguilla TaxID=7936 RepID=A0A0E9TFC7_ANGAN